jgi:Transposase DDE domain group 1
MTDDSQLRFSFPAIFRKKVTAAFDGGRLTSDGGVLLLAGAEKQLGLCDRLASCIVDRRNPSLITHAVNDILRARILAIACGYEDADDLDDLRHDPGFKLAQGKLPEASVGLCSQPTMSRWENMPGLGEVTRMMAAMVDTYCRSYKQAPAEITLDIDDTVDIVHGAQQLAFWNGFHQERCFLPIHIYDTSGRPVAMVLRTGKTPSGAEIVRLLARLLRRIRRHWPKTRLTLRGDSHYGRPEVMKWCETKRISYVFGLAGNKVLHRDPEIVAVADALCVKRAVEQEPALRCYAEIRYGAASWKKTRRVAARIEATTLGLDIRFVVTNLTGRNAEYLYDTLYCARGQAENLIKRHKSQLASDRTSCRSPLANQVRLILHTAAYWLMWMLQQAVPETSPLKVAEFTTLRNKLLKIAARVTETASRIRIKFATACPEAALFRQLAVALYATPP